MSGVERVRSFLTRVVTAVREENVPFMAGSIAYQAFVSLVPLLVLAVFLVSLVSDRRLAARIVGFFRATFSPAVAAAIERAISGQTGSVRASLIGLVTLLWGTFKVFRGLDTAFSEIYGTSGSNSLPDQVVDGVVVLAALGGALVATVLATTAFAALSLPYLGVLTPLLLVVGLVVAFVPMYWRFPDADASLRTTLPGVAVAALGWMTLQALFQAYVALAGASDAAGFVGAALLLLTWLYLGGLVLLLGAVVNAVVAGQAPRAGTDTSGDGTDDRPTGVTAGGWTVGLEGTGIPP